MSDRPTIIRVAGMATPHGWQEGPNSGKYVASYTPHGHGGRGKVVLTSDPDLAHRYPSVGAALSAWRETSKTHPVRMDGKPNRPLTAYTVEVMPADDTRSVLDA